MPISKERNWIRVATPGLPPAAKIYAKGECKAIVSQDDQGHWRLTIYCGNRYPTIDEIRDARFTLCAKIVNMALLLSPEGHPDTRKNGFYLCEIEDAEKA